MKTVWDKIFNRVKKGWIKGKLFVDKDGNSIPWSDNIDESKVKKCCLYGAVLLEVGLKNSDDIFDILKKTIPSKYHHSIPVFNDHFSVKKHQVLNLIHACREASGEVH